MKYGFITVAAGIPRVRVADVNYNILHIKEMISEAESKGVEIMVFPELSITGYTCQDLFRSQLLLEKAEEGLIQLLTFTRKLDIIIIVGLPIPVDGLLLNCAIAIQQGKVLGVVPKTFLPNYGEFYEKRWFASSRDIMHPHTIYVAGSPTTITSDPKIFTTVDGVKFGIEICEDLWAPVPPSNNLTLAGADIIFNLSASDELIGKHAYLRSLLMQQSARTICGYVYAGCGFGESTQDVVYGGNAIIVENGKIICEGNRFSLEPQMEITQIDVEKLRTERRTNTTFVNAQCSGNAILCEARPTSPHDFSFNRDVEPLPFIPKSGDMSSSCEEILSIQAAGLTKRLAHTGCKRVVIGISGGLDSTLALLISVRSFEALNLDHKGIFAVTMPGFGTTKRTYNNAKSLMESLGVTTVEIDITKSVAQHFKDIGHDSSVHDVTYENCQARERTQILMDIANQVGGLVIGTGDLSELALGWATYNGDHMSMYGVNAGVPKTLIRHLVRYEAMNDMDEKSKATLLDIIDTPISPELIPADEKGEIKQKTEDLVGPYELHDFFLYHYLRFGFRPVKLYFLAQTAFGGNHPEVAKYDNATIKHWLKVFFTRFFSQQFKRSCLPDGPKVGSVSLSPRGDWRMPSDASCDIWIEEIDALE